MAVTVTRWRLQITGTVQGVGFRPFVYRVATALGLRGCVWNSPAGVVIEAEGPAGALAELRQRLESDAPPLARLAAIDVVELPPAGLGPFCIAGSQGGAERAALVPPDAALCPECRAEVLAPEDRRYGYPFTNCTHCGPRFTIVRALPYDRPQTTMAAFPLCPDCTREYHDPRDRRFHAQPVACPRCGPRAWFIGAGGTCTGEWAPAFAGAIQAGQVVAVRGLGGFHLTCAAHDPEAVARLRQRKRRPDKPLAVMARDLAAVRRYCHLSAAEEALLASPAAPVVVLQRRADAPLPAELAPGARTLGVMLPYTPLHLLLLAAAGTDLLVMTSGNRSGLPLARDNEDAMAELADVADAFLLHDREIANRCDDSVLRVVDGAPLFYRRSRGYVPVPIPVPAPAPGHHPTALGAGGEMKNAFCLVTGGQAFLSQHIGEMDVREGQAFFREALARLSRFLEVTPEVIGYDPHPGYQVSRLALGLPGTHCPVQHHHAHLAAVLAEHGVVEPAVGIILDGTGYGDDGTLWGGEILAGDLRTCRRVAHLGYLPLPGGERAIRQPWRTAVSALALAYAPDEAERLAEALFPGRPARAVLGMVRERLNSPPACGAGRWLDAAAALLGLCLDSTYEGHAATALAEAATGLAPAAPYPWRQEGKTLDLLPAVRALVADRLNGVPAPAAAARFQLTVATATATAAAGAAAAAGCQRVALGGGVFQNPDLLVQVRSLLQSRGLQVLIPRQVPPGDGGLALGQAVVALWRLTPTR